ncbi:MAG: multiheme c-type cytochrome [Myxococcaceae bacterium]
MRKISLGVNLVFLLFSACQCPQKTAADQTLLFTTRMQGYVEPCGCTSDPLGGLSRLATLVKQYPGATFVDAGDLLFDPRQNNSCVDKDKIALLLGTLKNLGLQGTVLGSSDDLLLIKQNQVPVLGSEGLAYLQIAPNLKIAVVSLPKEQLDKLELLSDVDLVIWGQAPGEMPLPPFRMTTSGPYVLSAGSQGQYLGAVQFYNLSSKTPKELIKLDTREQDRASQRALIQQRIDLLKSRPQNDFVTSRIKLAKEELAKLDAAQDEPLSGAYMRFQVIAIKRDIKQDPEITALLKAYEAKLPERLAACESSLECPKLAPGEASYVGAETCKTCHAPAYEFWKKALVKVQAKTETGQIMERLSGHSKAWKTLEDVNKTLDRNCIGCHSVGFMKPGGYCKAQDVDFRKNIQCESCHGPGSLHVKAGNKTQIKGQVPESQCRTCHHVPHIPTEESFVYEEKLRVILGPGHGESLLFHLNK